jgi:hypothetical protein
MIPQHLWRYTNTERRTTKEQEKKIEEGKQRRNKKTKKRTHAWQASITLHPVSKPLITAPPALREPLRGLSKQMMKKLRWEG